MRPQLIMTATTRRPTKWESIYGTLVALSQTDLKKMIANSSTSHKGYVILDIAALTQAGFQGALLVMTPLACTAACCSAWSGWCTTAPIRGKSA